ncbi:uncharacterized protein LOC110065599 isoform X1 [Orbicella faveolata]|uniref:uncharacterized protein LOC110065599 isoform X1 n=1 Tax=Orbicella faveolata TaxID=48498 RepID=UPI0009E259FD|nr:uncharacterized protein LOC110065599 isoform X1 [Orbicella faveolata]
MNEKNQESLKGSILDVIKNIEYCDVLSNEDMIIEHLRLLVNLSATNIAHDEIMTGVQDFFNMLSQSLSGKIQREVLRLLVNLSCNVNNLEGLLEFKPLLILQTFMLPDNQDDIVLRAVTISANLLASPDQYTEVFWFSKNCLPPSLISKCFLRLVMQSSSWQKDCMTNPKSNCVGGYLPPLLV